MDQALILLEDKSRSLQSIAEKFYGSQAKWDLLRRTNSDILLSPEEGYIRAGMVLVIP